MRKTILSAALAALFMIAGAAAQAIDANTWILGQGDRILLRTSTEPEFSGEYMVDETGRFFLPILSHGLDLGAFHVEGMTVSKVSELIESRMSKYYETPKVVVELVSYGVRPGYSVSIFGAVAHPQTLRYYEGMKLMDVLVKALLANEADISKLAVFRGDNQVEYVDIRDMMAGKDLVSNIPLLAGDTIIVPFNQPTMKMKIIVLGKVAAPGTIFVPEDTQILDLLGRAGGTVGRAAVGNIYVIRVVEGEPVIINSDVKSLLKFGDLKENIVLKDGDVVFVPETSRVDINKIIQNLSMLNLIKSTFEID